MNKKAIIAIVTVLSILLASITGHLYQNKFSKIARSTVSNTVNKTSATPIPITSSKSPFDYSKYPYTDLSFLASEYFKDHPNKDYGDVVSIYKKPLHFKYRLIEYPTEDSDKKYVSSIKYVASLYGFNDQDLGYATEYVVGDYQFVIIFHKPIISYLSNEAKIGDTVNFYGALSHINRFDNRFVLFVTEFLVE